MNTKKETRITCLVPSNMSPNKETFVNLGFEFKTIPNNSLYLATLPEGWKSVADEDFFVNLIDENGYEKGFYIHYNCNNSMELNTRFYISPEFDPDDRAKNSIYCFVKDRINGKILFSSGTYHYYSSNIFDKFQKIGKAKTFLNENYPDWEDPTKYWDLDENAIKYWQK